MSDEQWGEGFARSLAVFLSGRAIQGRDARGQPFTDSDFLLMLNAHHEPLAFTLPEQPADANWKLCIDTAGGNEEQRQLRPGEVYTVEGRSLALFENP
jgi:isoamylase